MRKSVMVSVALLFGLLFSASSVYAGSINGPEAGLISKASGTFQYQGKRYVATAAAMGQLRAYLSRDDVDLTQDQANRAASLMYSNVEGGVLDGYLTPVGGAAAGTGGDSNSVLNRPQKGASQKTKKEKAGAASVKVEEPRSTLQVTGADGQAILKAKLPVKDTGISFGSAAVLVCCLLLLILPVGLVMAWKFKLFARDHES